MSRVSTYALSLVLAFGVAATPVLAGSSHGHAGKTAGARKSAKMVKCAACSAMVPSSKLVSVKGKDGKAMKVCAACAKKMARK